MSDVDIVVVGAGVVGLAVARELALDGREVVILEAGPMFGTGISSRNSEVIHAGIYYPHGSLKARLCVAGREQLYEYCESRGVPYKRCEKLIVATSETQLRELDALRASARVNGVELQRLSRGEAQDLEPELECVGALLSPNTGIVDSHAYMLSLLGEAERNGATLVCGSSVTGARVDGEGIDVVVNGGDSEIRARVLVNCAGLGAPDVAASIEGFPAACVRKGYWAKGSYFTLTGRSPFSRLVYPVPEPGGLGVHLTLDLAGRARFGPDVQWVDRLDYEVDPQRCERFYGEVRKYWPGLADGSLEPAYAGIRPKIVPQGAPSADFVIEGPATHGVRSVVNLFGIESPGLTASLALAEKVVSEI